MSDLKEMIVDVVEKMFSHHIKKETVDLLEEGKWATNLWDILIKNEIVYVTVSEKNGGAGGDLEDLLSLYYLIGKYAAPIPFVEMTLANYFLEQFNMTVSRNLITYSFPENTIELKKDRTVSGNLYNVPWARHAQELLVFVPTNKGTYAMVIHLQDTNITFETNLAAEPRDTVSFENAKVIQQTTTPLSNEQINLIRTIDTAAKNACAVGAIETIFNLSVQFSKDRKQFGQPIHRFQLIQKHLANLASEHMISKSSLDSIIAALFQKKEHHEVAYMRIQLDESTKIVSSAAHQVHAAIGVTHEHRLHHFTRRLWAWRDEGYPASYWKKEVAQSLHQLKKENVWSYITKY